MDTETFTGERPGWGEGFEYDEARHLAAYRYAESLAAGRRVLDAGCGEGFGTQSLAAVADSVVGVDYSPVAVGVCREKWQADNLRFDRLDLVRPGNFDETFDLVCNFQVLEHIDDELPFLEGLRRRLGPDGVLLLTTPNRLKSFSENPYHVREYTAEELDRLLRQVFPDVTVRGMFGNDKVTAFDAARERSVKRILRLDPLGIRNMLPASVVNFAFARLAQLVRRQAGAGTDAASLSPADFEVRDDGLHDALDLVAACRG